MNEPLEWLKWVAQNYGLYAAMVVYFMARDTARDMRQEKVIEELQTEMRTIIIPLTRDAVAKLALNTDSLERATILLDRVSDRLEDLTERGNKDA